MEVAGCT